MAKIYLFLLASLCGIELFAGIIVAPTIFHNAKFLGENALPLLTSGRLMTEIFVKFNYFLLFVSLVIFYAEFISKQYEFRMKISRVFTALINAFCAVLFAFYLTPEIQQAQVLGIEAVQSAEFSAIHSTSEYVFKLLALAQIFLFVTYKKAEK